VPQPGLSLLQLAEGDAAAAQASAVACLDSTPAPLRRASVLPAAVEAALAAGDHEWARGAVAELSDIADEYGSPALLALAARGRAALRLVDEQPSEAARDARRSVELFRVAEMPYEQAGSRLLLGEALLRCGDRLGSEIELRSAMELFARLGATLEWRSTQQRIDALQAAQHEGETAGRGDGR
jgi:hypothetical protein